MTFDGANDLINISTTPILPSSDFTISAQVKLSNTSTGAMMITGADGSYTFSITASGALRMSTKRGLLCSGAWSSGEKIESNPALIQTNTKYYLTAVYKSTGSYSFYVNGANIAPHINNVSSGTIPSCTYGKYIG